MQRIWRLKDIRTGRTYPISSNIPLTIGRSPGNMVTVPVSDVSRHHAQILSDSYGHLTIQDINSANGTFVNRQKVVGSQSLTLGDKIQIGSHRFVIESNRSAPKVAAREAVSFGQSRSSRSNLFLLGGVTLVIAILAVVFLRGQTEISKPIPEVQTAFSPVPVAVQTPTLTPQMARNRALAATVLIFTDDGWGSGSLVNPKGYILTNAHVVANLNDGSFYQYVDIYMNPPGANDLPEYEYIAETIEADLELDLALLKIVADKNGKEIFEDELDLVSVPLGDPHRLQHQDPLTIIGFPGTGLNALGHSGGSVTVTTGTVAGFESDQSITNAWIKTDAEISAGNSGGMALDKEYQLIGIPTAVNVNPTGKLGYIHSIAVAKPLLAKIPD